MHVHAPCSEAIAAKERIVYHMNEQVTALAEQVAELRAKLGEREAQAAGPPCYCCHETCGCYTCCVCGSAA